LSISEAPPFWKIIVMEYLDLKPVCDLKNHASIICGKLAEIISLMRDNEFVHGDFRSSNVLGVLNNGEFQGQVVVLDFDWSGKHGVVRYPNQMSKEIQWPQGCQPGALLDYTHDETWANSFLR
jgi:RIO-like serine/threonine protein kinase